MALSDWKRRTTHRFIQLSNDESRQHPREFFDGYKGYLSTDGYSGYNDMPGIINVGCLAHAQRMFTNVIKAMPPNNDSKSTLAEEWIMTSYTAVQLLRKLLKN